MKRLNFTMSCTLLFVLLLQTIVNVSAQNYINGTAHPKFETDLPDPAVIDGTDGGTYNIFMAQKAQHLGIFDPTTGYTTPLETDIWGYGLTENSVTFPGPTFWAKENKKIKVKWKNSLPMDHLLDVDVSLHWANPPSGIATVAHLHGGHTESASDSLPEAWFIQNFEHKGRYFVKEKYEYDNDQEAATLWYHDHALGITRLNVYAGLAGFYLLRDNNELDLIEDDVLPGGDYEREIVLQDRLFVQEEGMAQLYFPSVGEAGSGEECPIEPDPNLPNPSVVAEFFRENTEDLFMIVNGAAWPKLDVEPRKYRFRMLNGSDSRFYLLEFYNAETGGSPQNFMQIGTDDGFLEQPVSLTRLIIAPGERMDIVMDFTNFKNQSLWLRNLGPDEPYGGGIPGVDFDVSNEATTGQIMKFNVGPTGSLNPFIPNASVNTSTTLRSTIPTLIPDGPVRKLALFEGRDEYCRLRPILGTVDEGSLLWDEPITENPDLDATEIWEIYNATADAHPIHLHLVSFQILNRQEFTGSADYDYGDIDITGLPRIKLSNINLVGNPVAPPANEDGWKDTGIVEPGQVIRVIAKFDREGRYVWHCHILSHEDHEMMRPFHVGNLPKSIDEYVLLATDGDLEFDECVAHSRGIGIMSAGDEAEIEDNAIVTAEGTFVKAPEIDVDNSSAVAVEIEDEAAPLLPAFRYNNTNVDDDDEVSVDDGETVVLTESVYEDIKVGDDATIIFSGHEDVYIEDLETEDDVTILFDQCTNLMLSGKMELGKDGNFNTSEMDVTVFAEDDITIKRRNVVYGILYSKEKFYTQAASSSSTTQLHGLFIGEEVEANEFGEYWAQSFNINCDPGGGGHLSPEITQPATAAQDEVKENGSDKIPEIITFKDFDRKTEFTLHPNPASNEIHLSVKGQSENIAIIRILNLQGKLMAEKNLQHLDEGEIVFDVSQFTNGMYTIMVFIDGNVPVTKKFVVQK